MTIAKKWTRSLVKTEATAPALTVSSVPEAILRAMGPPPLLPGEDPAIYWAFYDGIRAAIEPADVLAELYCGEGVALAWESLRYRRQKTSWLRSMMPTGVRAALATILDAAEARALTKAWAEEQPEAIERVQQLLKISGPPLDVIAAHTLATNIRLFSAIDELGMRAEARRDAALREIDRRRAAKRLQQSYQDVEDAEYEVVPRPETTEAV